MRKIYPENYNSTRARTGKVYLPDNTVVDTVNPSTGRWKVETEDGVASGLAYDRLSVPFGIEQFTGTLLADVSKGDLSFDVDTGAETPDTTMFISLKNSISYNNSNILSVVPLGGGQFTLNIDTPIDSPYNNGDTIYFLNKSLDVSGTLSTPEIGYIGGLSLTNMIFDIAGINLAFFSDVLPNDETLAGISALTNGLLIRSSSANILNAKVNVDLSLAGFEVQCYVYRNPNYYATYCDLKLDPVMTLSSTDKVEILIRDDLTSFNSFTGLAICHLSAV